MKAPTSHVNLRGLVLYGVIGLAPLSHAQTSWTKPTGTGNWHDTANWSGGVLPLGTSGESQIVNGHAEIFSAGAQANNLRIGGSPQGARGTATITVRDGGSFSGGNVYVGVGTGANGSVNVTGTGSTWTSTNALYICIAGGTGNFNVTQGGTLVTQTWAFIGYGAGSNGHAVVSGPGSFWSAENTAFVGYLGGQGTLTLENGGTFRTALNGAGRLAIGYSGSSNGTVNIGSGGAAGIFQGAGIYVNSGSTGKLNFNHNEGAYTFSSSLEGNLSVEQKGSGTTILTSSANTYTGGTTLSGGKLVANNTTGSAFGSGNVTASINTTLAGIGRFTGSATIYGSYAPGNSVGNLTSGDLIFKDTGIYEWEINNAGGSVGNAAGGWDHATVNGVLSFEPGALLKIASLGTGGLALGFNPDQSYLWTIATASGGIDGIENVTVDTTGFLNSFNGAFTLSENGNQLQLGYTPVPEPAGAALFAFGILTVAARRRRSIY